MDNKSTDKQFPGYPHYPDNEDIMRPENNNGKAPIDVPAEELLPRADTDLDKDYETDIIPGTDADVTGEDILLLEAAEQNMNTPDDLNLLFSSLDAKDGDGDELNEPEHHLRDFTGTSLDVPGSEDDDADEDVGSEDEENNYYSLGGDNHEAQEENKGE